MSKVTAYQAVQFFNIAQELHVDLNIYQKSHLRQIVEDEIRVTEHKLTRLMGMASHLRDVPDMSPEDNDIRPMNTHGLQFNR